MLSSCSAADAKLVRGKGWGGEARGLGSGAGHSVGVCCELCAEKYGGGGDCRGDSKGCCEVWVGRENGKIESSRNRVREGMSGR